MENTYIQNHKSGDPAIIVLSFHKSFTEKQIAKIFNYLYDTAMMLPHKPLDELKEWHAFNTDNIKEGYHMCFRYVSIYDWRDICIRLCNMKFITSVCDSDVSFMKVRAHGSYGQDFGEHDLYPITVLAPYYIASQNESTNITTTYKGYN